MEFNTLGKLKKMLRDAIESQDIKDFEKFLKRCPLRPLLKYNGAPENICPDCPFFETADEFKKRLRKAIDTQDVEEFESSLWDCPLTLLKQNYSHETGLSCLSCPLYDKNGPTELIGRSLMCLRSSMSDICRDYTDSKISKETALARLILMGIKLLAYLDSKDSK